MQSFRPFFFLVLVCACLVSSCVTHKRYKYLIPSANHLGDSSNFTTVRPDYVLQPGDVLDIKVSSNVESSDIEIFNKRFESTNSNVVGSTAGSYFSGYLIDSTGFIDLPLMGKVKSAGFTCSQLNDSIQAKLNQFVNYSTVTTKLGIFRLTILGEVLKPGTHELSNCSNLTVFQAIGLAGDVTDYANKKRVKLIRKKGDKVEVVKLNLATVDMIASPYYYICPNDVIYVEPLRAKVIRTNAANVTLVFSALTLFVVLITRL